MADRSIAAIPASIGGQRRGLVIEFALFFGSVLALQGSRFLFTLVVASGLQPAEFTTWALFVTLVGYAPNVLLGLGNGMNRLIPIQMGRGEPREADRSESATWMIVAVVGIAAALAAALLVGFGDRPWLPIAIIAGAATTVYQIQQFAFRTRLLFGRASGQQWLWAVTTAAFLVWLILLSDRSITAALWAWTLATLSAVAAGFILRRPALREASLDRARHLIAMGFPIMLAGLLGTLLYTADRWVASAKLDPASAGSYGLASLIASAVFLIPVVIAQQHYPRLAMLHGRSNSVEALRPAAMRQSLIAAAASTMAGVAVTFFVVLAIEPMLPAYEVLAPTVILSAGVVALAAATGFGNLLIVVGALWRYVAAQGVSFAFAAIAMWVGSGLWGGVGLACGIALGQVTLLVTVVLVANRLPRSVEHR